MKNKSGFAVAQRRCWSGPRKGILSGIQRKSKSSKIYSETGPKENVTEDVFVRASIRDNKKSAGGTYFLLKGIHKVTGEFTLICLGYNIKRAKNLLGINKMMEILAKA